ncbi:MAG: outer membrane beta-barrel protein [Rhizobacter sp.]|nr:outer membrane beta-barrel protein [Ferruginibacter sp.]
MKKMLMLLACSYCFAFAAKAQGTLKGKLIDSASKAPVGLATVTVFKAADTAIITYRLSSPDGEFKVPGLPFNVNCRVVVSVSGYSGYRKEFIVNSIEPVKDLGTVALPTSTTSLDEVVIFSERPPVVIKKDTVEFNASAFKTLPNALVEDLLKKLPGVQVDREGNIVVNGKPVNKITVDGKSFFGDDPKMATRNLPANVIDKIQVTDDKEEMLRSGDDNPNNVGKVVNITLKKGIKKGWFGKLYAGGGTGDLYEAGGIANIYRDTLQISVLGYLNNLNKPGFSYTELMQAGGMERNRANSNNNSTSVWRNPNGSGVSINGVNFGGMQSYGGVTTSKGLGINLNHTPSTKRSFYLQYFRGNINVNRTNITGVSQFNGDTVVTNNTSLKGPIETNAHNIGLGARLKPDSVTNILFNANYTIGLQDEQRISDVFSNNNILGALSEGNIFQNNPAKTYYYRHNINITRLSKTKKGRRFNFNQSLDINNRFNDYSTESFLRYHYPVAFDSNYAQLRVEKIPRTDAAASFNYSEPLTKILTARIGGRYEYSQLYNTINTYNKDVVTDKYDIPNADLSSRFRRIGNRVIVTPGLEFKWKDLTITPGIRILMQSFDNRLASMPEAITQKQNNLLPTLGIVYKKLSFNYSKDIVMPGFQSLIPVTDNTNPYLITKGNTSLAPMERNNISLNYNYNNTKTNFYANVYGNGSFTNNDVVQSVKVDAQGVQTTMPVNADGSSNFYFNFNLNKQYKKNQKFIFSWNTGGNYNFNRNRLFYNDEVSLQSTFNFTNWFGLNLNFNDKVEFNTSVSKGYNFTRYTNENFRKINIRYTWFENELVIRWPKHFIWESQVQYDYNSNLPTTDARNIIRWHAAVNYTMLKSEALVLKLYVFDILKTNRSQYATVNRNMITSYQTNTLSQYGLATLTYNVRPYGGAKKNIGGREKLFLF